MNLGQVTKRDKRNKTRSKKIEIDVMSENCDPIVIFWIFYQFVASRGLIPDEESVKFIFSVIVTFFLGKTENRTKKSLIQLSHCFE